MSVPLHESIEEFAKLAGIDLNEFRRLSKKNVFNRLETFLTPKIQEEDPELAHKAQQTTQREREYFRKKYNVTARLTGSMPLKLGVPGDVDLDFYSRIQSPQKFNQVVARLEKNPDYVGSKYNKPGAAFQVYQRQARGENDFPVDFAIAYGPDADRLSAQINEKERASAELPKELREALIAKKLMLKHTPFDIKGKRYKAWKRNLDKALGGEAIRLKREPHPDLIADLQKHGQKMPHELKGEPPPRILFHGAPFDVHDPVHDRGLIPMETAEHNRKIVGGLDQIMRTVGAGGKLKRKKETEQQRQSVYLTDNPHYAANYGRFNTKGKFSPSTWPNVYAVQPEADKLIEQNPEGSMATGKPVLGRVWLHEGEVPRERTAKVIFEKKDGEFVPKAFVPLDKVIESRIRKGTRTTPPPEKTAAVLDLEKPDDFTEFQRFVSRQDVFGHRTPHAEAVLGSGKIISALEALQKGKIKTVETGRGVGARKEISTDNKLTNDQISGLKDALFAKTTAGVDADKAADIASEAGMEYNEMMAEFLRRKKGDIRKHLGTVSDPEEYRRSHLSIPKLGPNIFVTKGGVMDEPKYGDVSILVRSRTAQPSPFANTLTDEHIIEQKKPGQPRSLSVKSSLVIAPQAKIRSLSRKFPGYKFVKEEQIPEQIRSTLYKPTRSAKELTTRIVPKLLNGELRLQHR